MRKIFWWLFLRIHFQLNFWKNKVIEIHILYHKIFYAYLELFLESFVEAWPLRISFSFTLSLSLKPPLRCAAFVCDITWYKIYFRDHFEISFKSEVYAEIRIDGRLLQCGVSKLQGLKKKIYIYLLKLLDLRACLPLPLPNATIWALPTVMFKFRRLWSQSYRFCHC